MPLSFMAAPTSVDADSDLFPKMAPARSINPYSVQTVTSFRGEQRPAKACTPFAAITKFRIEFSAVPQIFLARPRSPLRRAAVSRPSRTKGGPTAVFRFRRNLVMLGVQVPCLPPKTPKIGFTGFRDLGKFPAGNPGKMKQLNRVRVP